MIDLFWEIWAERPHYSEVSGVFLGHEPRTYFFSHIMSRGSSPRGKLDKNNIMLMTLDEHRLWENYKHKIKDDPKWKHVFERAESLKIEYAKKI